MPGSFPAPAFHWFMSQRTLFFEPLLWKKPQQTGVTAAALVVATVLWASLYAWVGWTLWAGGIGQLSTLQLIGFGASILLGVGLIVAWRGAWPSIRKGRRRWGALNLEQMMEMDPGDFEAYVAQRVFNHRGYTVNNTRNTKDGGVDILITDRFGQTAVVQCKRYRGTVGESTVRDLYGTMIHFEASYAYLVTTGAISDEARRWVMGKPIELIDGRELVEITKSDEIL